MSQPFFKTDPPLRRCAEYYEPFFKTDPPLRRCAEYYEECMFRSKLASVRDMLRKKQAIRAPTAFEVFAAQNQWRFIDDPERLVTILGTHWRALSYAEQRSYMKLSMDLAFRPFNPCADRKMLPDRALLARR